MRRLIAITMGLLVAACGSVEYRDNNAAVDVDPRCIGSDGQPGDEPPSWCKREASTTWKPAEGGKVDFKDDDD